MSRCKRRFPTIDEDPKSFVVRDRTGRRSPTRFRGRVGAAIGATVAVDIGDVKEDVLAAIIGTMKPKPPFSKKFLTLPLSFTSASSIVVVFLFAC